MTGKDYLNWLQLLIKHPMSHKFSILLGLCYLAILSTSCNSKSEENSTGSFFPVQPNIVLIQVDDMGYDDLSLRGNTVIETPSLDKLGTESVQFEQFHLQNVCAPSRAALLTGKNFFKTGVSGVHGGRDYVNLDEILISELLQNNEYETGMWGKWHSGKTHGYWPWDRGFDEAYYATLYNYRNNVGLMNGTEVKTTGFSTDTLAGMAINFIQKNKNKPFFAYVSFMAPHARWDAPEEYYQKYKEKGLSESFSMLAGMINNLDHNIGRILSCLEENGLDENTVVFFLSDNGPHFNSSVHSLNDEEWELRNPHNFRGCKGRNWENGIKSNLFLRWKGKYSSAIINVPTQIEDIFPTILELTGTPRPDSLFIDGKSLLNTLDGDCKEERLLFSSHANIKGYDPVQRNKLYRGAYAYMPITPEYKATFQFENQLFAVRKGEYKYLMNESGEGSEGLFNIAVDSTETNNLIDTKPEKAKELRLALKKWYEEIMETPHAFQMPEFQIGYQERAFNQIPAISPARISKNLINSDHLLMNWKEEGDFADYKLNVLTPGNYKLFIVHEIKGFEKLTFKATYKEDSVLGPLTESAREFSTIIANESAYWDDYRIEGSFRKTIVRSEIGFLDMPEGSGYLKIELADIKEGYQAYIKNSIISIQLLRKK